MKSNNRKPVLAPRMLITIVFVEINNTNNATKFVGETGATTSITTLDMDSTIVLGRAGTTSIS